MFTATGEIQQAICRTTKCGLFRERCIHSKPHYVVVFGGDDTCVSLDFVCIAHLKGTCELVRENE